MADFALHRLRFSLALSACLSFLIAASFAFQATEIPDSQRIHPEDLVKILQSSSEEKPVMLQVGSHVLFAQAHIPNSEYMGAASTEELKAASVFARHSCLRKHDDSGDPPQR